MTSRFSYPVAVEPDGGGFFVVTFPDVPEAGTDAPARDGALAEAEDCLIAALGGYVEMRRDIPEPSRPKRGQESVSLPPLVAAKLALYQAMRDAGVSGTSLARRLGLTEGAVRRLLDLDHRSHIGQVETALSVLGKRLVLEVRDAA